MTLPAGDLELFHRFTFEAAHRLPQLGSDHPCARLHGHGYRVEIALRGPVDPSTGMICDLLVLRRAAAAVLAELDHRCLNDLPGLDSPTCENLCCWLWARFADLPGLCQVTVQETADTGCRYAGPPATLPL